MIRNFIQVVRMDLTLKVILVVIGQIVVLPITESGKVVSTHCQDSGIKFKKAKSKLKSDMEAEASDDVLSPQLWPHLMLQDEFVGKKLKFYDLDFKQFNAGELEIISLPNIGKKEEKGRIEFLKLLSYHAN